MQVSVIIPTYNRSKMIKNAIDSVLNQTFKDFEIIVINDGSTDNTQEVLNEYNSKITVIAQENSGLNTSRNKAIKLAKGKYIALLDDDDIWRDYKLDLEVKLLEQYQEIPFVFSDFTIFKENGDKIYPGLQTYYDKRICWTEIFDNKIEYSYNNSSYNIFRGNIYSLLLSHPIVLPSTTLFRKEVFSDKFQFLEYDSMCGDWEFFARLSRDSDILFIETDTTLNGGHNEGKRLTKSPPYVHFKSRLALIDRVWKNDLSFYEQNKEKVNSLIATYKLSLVEHEIFNNDKKMAKQLLLDYKTFGGRNKSVKYLFFKILIYLPGSRILLKYFRKVLFNY